MLGNPPKNFEKVFDNPTGMCLNIKQTQRASPTRASNPKGVNMTTTITTQVTCPMHHNSDNHLSCGGEMVEAKTANHNTTWKVAPCSSLTAQGWTGPQAVLRFTEIDRYVPAQTVWQHRDGMVTFAGAIA